MLIRETSFFSDRFKLDASFYLPDSGEPSEGLPLVVACSGFHGWKTLHPERFARYLTRQGYRCFGFDYRGFPKSEGEPGHVLCEEQTIDIVNAVTFAAAETKTPFDQVVLLGWGMGGGLIIDAAALLPRLSGVVPINGFYDGKRLHRAIRGERGFAEFQEWTLRMRTRLVQTGVIEQVDPFEIYPLDPVTTGYVDTVLRKNPTFGTPVRTTFADSLLRFRPERSAGELAGTPILIAHGERNELHPPAEAEALFACCREPKELYWIEAAGHTEWMHDDHPTFQALMQRIDRWIRAHAGHAERAASAG
jgi:uncharacterized protein